MTSRPLSVPVRLPSAGVLVALAALCLAALAPVAWSKPLQRAYVQTWQRYLSRIAPPGLVLVGDSLAQDAHCLAPNPLTAVNLGQGGLSIAEITPQISAAAAYRPKRVLVIAGINDIVLYGRSTAQIQADYAFLIRQAEASNLTSRLVITLLPYTAFDRYRAPVDQANFALRALAARHEIPVIDLNAALAGGQDGSLTSDGIHLDKKACLVWRGLLKHVG